MVQYTRNIDVKIDDGSTERFVIQTYGDDAVRVDLSGDGAPYDVDIQTASEHKQQDNFNAGDYTSCLPLGAETYIDASQHTTATEVVGESVFVAITNNSGGQATFIGTIDTHSQDASTTTQEFSTRESGNRASAYRDGQSLSNSKSTTTTEISFGQSKFVDPSDGASALQTALDNHDDVLVLAGTLLLDQNVDIPSGTTLRGMGMNQTKIQLQGDFEIGEKDDTGKNIRIKDIHFDANGKERPVNIRSPRFTYAIRCRVTDSTAGGIAIRANNDPDTRDYGFLYCEAKRCSGVSFDCGGTTGGGPKRARIIGCRVYDMTHDRSFTHAVSVEGTSNCIVGYNQIFGNRSNIGTNLGINLNAATDSVCIGNTVQNCQNGINVSNGTARRITIGYNTLDYIINEGIEIQNGGTGVVEDIQVGPGNQLYRIDPNGTGSDSAGLALGVRVKNKAHANIIGNFFDATVQRYTAIDTGDAGRPPKVANNVYKGDPNNPSTRAILYGHNRSQRGQVVGNKVDDGEMNIKEPAVVALNIGSSDAFAQPMFIQSSDCLVALNGFGDMKIFDFGGHNTFIGNMGRPINNLKDTSKIIANRGSAGRQSEVVTFSSDGATTTFRANDIFIDFIQDPSGANDIWVEARPTSADAKAAGIDYVEPIDDNGDGSFNGVDVIFESPPASGTDNVEILVLVELIKVTTNTQRLL